MAATHQEVEKERTIRSKHPEGFHGSPNWKRKAIMPFLFWLI